MAVSGVVPSEFREDEDWAVRGTQDGWFEIEWDKLTPEINLYAHRLGGGPFGNGMLDCRIGGTYEKPLAVSAERFLVSKGGTIQLRDFDANAVSLLLPEGGMGYYCPMPVRPTPRPPVQTENVMDRDAVQRMRSFTHMMPGELQGCVGCHADRNSATTHGGTLFGMRGPVQELQTPAWGVKGFSYAEVVQGVFDRNCVECHNEREQPANVDLTGDMTDFFNVSYDVLCRTGTQAEWNWIRHGSPSGPKYDSVRGMSPWVEWIWTINGAGHNVLEITPKRWGSPASKLAEIIRTGHPDEDGKPRVDVPDEDRRRVYLWIDLNVPYYGTSSSNHKARLGSRRMMPLNLDSTLAEVASRRCASCHKQGIPRKFYTRVMNPENNSFLLAPLSLDAGGTQKCGQPVFLSKDDPHYRKILETFEPIHVLLKERPRADMAGFELMCDHGD